MLAALAFVPTNDVVRGFEEIEQSDFVQENDCMVGLLAYFEAVYIGKVYSGGRRQPLFPIE